MDESTFQKELSKYKVVRQPDYYKPRIKNSGIKQSKLSNTASAGKESTSNSVSVTTINPNESNFWELFSAANSNILTTAESMKFIETLKLVSFSPFMYTYIIHHSPFMIN